MHLSIKINGYVRICLNVPFIDWNASSSSTVIIRRAVLVFLRRPKSGAFQNGFQIVAKCVLGIKTCYRQPPFHLGWI